jgi:hypothetical protein
MVMTFRNGFFTTLVLCWGFIPAWGQDPRTDPAPLEGQSETASVAGGIEQDPYLVREREVISESEAGTATLILQTVGKELPLDFRLMGEVRYEDVEGQGYLEMLVDHGERGEFFSRTLADSGPLAALEGSSDWRAFELPFHGGGKDIKVNVVLPGKGKVWVKKVRLVEGEKVPGAWFSEPQAGVIGGWMGAICGIFGGIIGCAAGFLVPRGKGRTLVLGLLGALAVSGLLQILTGMVGLVGGQPWYVQQLFWTTGLLNLILGLILIPVINRQYSMAELRKMEAMDAG